MPTEIFQVRQDETLTCWISFSYYLHTSLKLVVCIQVWTLFCYSSWSIGFPFLFFANIFNGRFHLNCRSAAPHKSIDGNIDLMSKWQYLPAPEWQLFSPDNAKYSWFCQFPAMTQCDHNVLTWDLSHSFTHISVFLRHLDLWSLL